MTPVMRSPLLDMIGPTTCDTEKTTRLERVASGARAPFRGRAQFPFGSPPPVVEQNHNRKEVPSIRNYTISSIPQPKILLGRIPGPVLAFSVSSRAVGCAFLDRAHPLLAARRIRNRGSGIVGVEAWVARLLERCDPFIVVIVADQDRRERSSRYVHHKEAIRHRVEFANVSSLELARDEITTTLGIEARSDVALSRAIISAVPTLATYLKGARRFQTDSEREWTPALVAAGAALAAVHFLTCEIDLPS